MNKQETIEQSRVLWIVLSALTVIAIVIAAGIFFFFPSTDDTAGQPLLSSLNQEKTGRDFDPIEYVRNADGYPEMVDPEIAEEDFSVNSSDEIQTPAITAEGMNPTVVETEETSVTDETNVTEETNVIEVPAPAVAVKPKENQEPPVPVVKKQQTMKVSVTVYWIQVGSYNDMTKAEEVRDYLQTQNISSEIQTKSVSGKTYFRVRIGAFQTKGEADRFLDPIKTMKNFEESYVVQTTMVKEVPVN
ncbi:MAG: SPOR domain-containing protein [Spirochaetaceae bacterium]|nr:SPOR domain-containing protein [Spirochaetaceae bacterium]